MSRQWAPTSAPPEIVKAAGQSLAVSASAEVVAVAEYKVAAVRMIVAVAEYAVDVVAAGAVGQAVMCCFCSKCEASMDVAVAGREEWACSWRYYAV